MYGHHRDLHCLPHSFPPRRLSDLLPATGRCARARFEQTLFTNGLSEEGFVAMMRGDLARGLVSETVTAGAEVPVSLAKLLYADEAEARVAEITFLPDEKDRKSTRLNSRH